jgi:hypothetical protein
MAKRQPKESATYRFDELAVWKTGLPSAEHAVLPPSNNRPNPLVMGALVYVSVFSQGAVCALERKTGKLLWRKEIPKFGGSAVHLAHGKLYAKTANTLFALEPETGKPFGLFVLMASQENQFTLVRPSPETVCLSATGADTYIA